MHNLVCLWICAYRFHCSFCNVYDMDAKEVPSLQGMILQNMSVPNRYLKRNVRQLFMDVKV